MSRSYTVHEIDRLRVACDHMFLYGCYRGRSGYSRAYQSADRIKAVEEMVRTHMLAGHTADDLLASEPVRENSLIV
jgi:hypothetical protein